MYFHKFISCQKNIFIFRKRASGFLTASVAQVKYKMLVVHLKSLNLCEGDIYNSHVGVDDAGFLLACDFGNHLVKDRKKFFSMYRLQEVIVGTHSIAFDCKFLGGDNMK